jgi:deazaflavin-dependent oxidoreductase (nitroreductase family)
MTDWSSPTFEDDLIADMRAHDGLPSAGPLAGEPLLILSTIGAKTGRARRSILTYSRDGDAFIVAGTNAGATTPPHWVANIAKDPRVTIEAGNRTQNAIAEITSEPARTQLWDRHVESFPRFAAYVERAGRVIPVVRITPEEG